MSNLGGVNVVIRLCVNDLAATAETGVRSLADISPRCWCKVEKFEGSGCHCAGGDYWGGLGGYRWTEGRLI